MINWADPYVQAATVTAVGVIGAAALTMILTRRNQVRADVVAAAATTAAAASELGQALINQLQEERAEIKESLARAHARIDALTFRQRYWEDYVNELRAHIESKLPPPAPPYPAGLLRIDLSSSKGTPG